MEEVEGSLQMHTNGWYRCIQKFGCFSIYSIPSILLLDMSAAEKKTVAKFAYRLYCPVAAATNSLLSKWLIFFQKKRS